MLHWSPRRRLLAGMTAAFVAATAPLAASPPIDLSFPEEHRTIGNVDLDADGVTDSVSVSFTESPDVLTVHWRRGIPGGGFAPVQDMIPPAADFLRGGDPVSLAGFVDVNGDRYPEIMISSSCTACNCASGKLLILVNHGPPNVTPLRYESIGERASVQGVDADGDGDVDLLLHETQGNCDSRYPGLRVLVNDGTGLQFGHYSVPEPEPVAIGDFNGDGRPDFVAPRSGSVYASIADNRTGLPVSIGATLPDGLPKFALARDIDSDGRLDALVGTANHVHVLLGDGHGAFSDRLYDIAATTPATVVDIDGDQDPDYAFGSGTDLVLFHHLTGSLFDQATVPFQSPLYEIATTDLNLDGLPDFLDLGPDSFRPLLSHGIGAYAGGTRYAGSAVLSGGVTAEWLDADGDGRLDLRLRGECGKSVYRGLGGGEFHAPLHHTSFDNGAEGFFLADLDRDGTLDAVSSPSGFAGFQWLRGLQHGAFELVPAFTWPETAKRMTAGAVADFDGDGDLDIVAARDDHTANGDVAVILNQGAGTFDPAVGYALGIRPTAILADDFDADGHPDILTNGWVTFLVYLHGRGDGQFDPPSFIEAGTPGALASADFDQDGRPDVAVHVANGVQILRNLGGGSFTPSAFIPTFPGAASQPIALVDANHDQHTDLLVAGSSVQLVRGRSGGAFDPPVTVPTTGFVDAVAAGDFDADGNDEIAVVTINSASPGNATLAVFQETQPDVFQSILATCAQPSSIVAGDFSGDGQPDILTASALFVNLTAGNSPAVISDFSAEQSDRRVTLRWRMDPAAIGAITGVDVERGFEADGPFDPVTPQALRPGVNMTFEDAVPGDATAAWYRIVTIAETGLRTASPTVSVQLRSGRQPTALRSVIPTGAGEIEVRYQVGGPETPLDMALYDIRGRRVATVCTGPEPAGTHVRIWAVRDTSGRPLARGVYWVRLCASGRTSVRSFVHTRIPAKR